MLTKGKYVAKTARQYIMLHILLMLTFSPCSLHQEKVKYYDLATERRAEFEKAMAQYNKKKVSVVHVCAYFILFFIHLIIFCPTSCR